MMKAQTLVNSQGLSTHSSRAVAGSEGTMLNWGDCCFHEDPGRTCLSGADRALFPCLFNGFGSAHLQSLRSERIRSSANVIPVEVLRKEQIYDGVQIGFSGRPHS